MKIMKKINLICLLVGFLLASCGNSPTVKEITEIGETVRKFHLSPLVANVEDVYIKKVKDKKGKEQDVVFKLNADCKFSYNLENVVIDQKGEKKITITLPTCEVTVSPDYSGNGPKYVNGGDGRYDMKVINEFKRTIKEKDIFKKLEAGGYDKKAFDYAKRLLSSYLKNFTDKEIEIKENTVPMKLRNK